MDTTAAIVGGIVASTVSRDGIPGSGARLASRSRVVLFPAFGFRPPDRRAGKRESSLPVARRWCEGGGRKPRKGRERVALANGDPALMRLFLRFANMAGVP
jgi:hypothetical protein